MKQIYSTGTSNRPAAPSVRASSPGAAIELALPLANYSAAPDRFPVRLALLNSPAGRVLTHATPDRAGHYFAHTIQGVPATADAQLAIQTWGSPLWQTTAPDSTGDLPDLPHLPVADVLDDDALKAWLASPARLDALEYVLAALLTTPGEGQVVLGLPADEVAVVVYAVTRALPPGLLDDFTFSTHEAEPSDCRARLIGHDPGEEGELPEAVYAETFAVNPRTGRRTPLPADCPFAPFAASRMAQGDAAALDDLKATWQRLNLKDANQFDLVYRLGRGTGTLTKAEAVAALDHPPLASWVSARADALHQFLEWALEDRDFAVRSFPRAAQSLRQKPELLAKLAASAQAAGVEALTEGKLDRAQLALEVVLPSAAPAKSAHVWGELLARFAAPKSLPWAARQFLLPRLVRYQHRKAATPETRVDPALAAWAEITPNQLDEFLALNVPKAYHLAAAKAVLAAEGQPEPATVRTLAARPELALDLLRAPDAVTLFAALLKEAPDTPWLETALARSADFAPEKLNGFFEAAIAGGTVDADRVIRTQGPRLLELFAGRSGLDTLGAALLADPPADLLASPPLLTFLKSLLSDAAVTSATATRIGAVVTVRSYLDTPSFDPESLDAVAHALALTPPALPATAKAECFAVVVTAVAAHPAFELQGDLERALVHLGGALAAGPTDLFENVLRELRTRPEFGRDENLVPTALAIALGATGHERLASELHGLDGHAFAVARDAAKRGGERMLTVIDRRAADWPTAARTQWGFLRAAVKPRGAKGKLRDAGLVFAGAALASAAWGVYCLLG